MKKLRILLVTRECWKHDSNEGNVLTSLFEQQPFELANIYCKPGLPDNGVCHRYFQMTDKMALGSLLNRSTMGREISETPIAENHEKTGEAEAKGFYDFFRKNNWELFYLLRDSLLLASHWEKGPLAKFVDTFSPDVVFAPMCYSRFVLAVQRFVIRRSGVPAVTYFYDDLYSLRQFRFSPIFWVNRFLLRKAIRKTLPFFAYAYTMSEEQALEYHHMLKCEMRILRKCATVSNESGYPHASSLRLIYAGGIYYGRANTLVCVAKAVQNLNSNSKISYRLDIYTPSPLTKHQTKRLNDFKCVFTHSAVDSNTLAQKYGESDVALHVESFSLKERLRVRLSFSTKIVDCLSSGCAVLAIGDNKQAGVAYLAAEDAAVCVTNLSDVVSVVQRLGENSALLQSYQKKAAACVQRNHLPEIVRATLRQDLEQLAEKKSAKGIACTDTRLS